MSSETRLETVNCTVVCITIPKGMQENRGRFPQSADFVRLCVWSGEYLFPVLLFLCQFRGKVWTETRFKLRIRVAKVMVHLRVWRCAVQNNEK